MSSNSKAALAARRQARVYKAAENLREAILDLRMGEAKPALFDFVAQLEHTFADLRLNVDPRIMAELQGGKKIQAIKVYREVHGVGLAEAKTAVEKLEEKLRTEGRL